MSEIKEYDLPDPRRIYDALIQRCKEVKLWYVSCLVDESWTGPEKKIPNNLRKYMVLNGIYIFEVVAFTQREAMLLVADNIPVLKFLDLDGDGNE